MKLLSRASRVFTDITAFVSGGGGEWKEFKASEKEINV